VQGLDYAKEYVDFSDKPQWIKDLTEKGTVPVLKDGEELIPDSGDICAYLGKTYPDPDLGKCTLEGTADKLFPSFVQFLTATGGEEKEKEQALVQQLSELEVYLAKSGDFLGGPKMMAYDCMVVRGSDRCACAAGFGAGAPPACARSCASVSSLRNVCIH
jgi:glutathione S-transferase